MKCDICGNPDGQCGSRKIKRGPFYIRMRSSYKEYSNVPCFARDMLSAVTKNQTVLSVETDDKELYVFQLDKKTQKTRIYGVDYNKFLVDYNMKHGDKIELNLDNPDKHGFVFLHPLDKYGFPKQRIEEQYAFMGTAKAVAVSKGLDLTYTDISKINRHVMDSGIGLGVIFVHRLSHSDVELNLLHIPKLIVSEMEISRRGTATLGMDDKDFTGEAEYYTSTDGRIRFTSGWTDFAKKNELEPGLVTVILFYKIDNLVHINFKVVP